MSHSAAMAIAAHPPSSLFLPDMFATAQVS